MDEGDEIRMELKVKKGKGYVNEERKREEDDKIGMIKVDRIYYKVRKVQ